MMEPMSHRISFSYLTLFPDLIRHYLSDALLDKAQKKNILEFNIHNLRDYSTNSYKSVDDTAYGGGDGMVFEMEPLVKALEEIKKNIPVDLKTQVIYLSPQGQKCNHQKICELSTYDHLVFVSGRYAGVDQRFIANFVDQEISIGDYVLSGGELPSLVLTEAISRQIPGVLGDVQSAEQDTFSLGIDGLLEAPQFTKPQKFLNIPVPDVLFGGNHHKISDWKKNISVLVTLSKRPDLLEGKKNIDWLRIFEFYKAISDMDRKNLQITQLDSLLEGKI
jgi:tRNA (guanine37-N1)-methyltransferase